MSCILPLWVTSRTDSHTKKLTFSSAFLEAAPVAVPKFSAQASAAPLENLTAATRSPRFFRHRRRSDRSPSAVEQKQLDELHIAIVGDSEE